MSQLSNVPVRIAQAVAQQLLLFQQAVRVLVASQRSLVLLGTPVFLGGGLFKMHSTPTIAAATLLQLTLFQALTASMELCGPALQAQFPST